MLETPEILTDQKLAKAIERGLKEAAAGDVMTHAEVWDGLDPALHE